MLVKARVFPGSNKKGIIKKSENAFEIKVKERPAKGMANRAAIMALSSFFNVPPGKVKLVRGFKRANKIFKIKSGKVEKKKSKK